jgi:hypothetical protein
MNLSPITPDEERDLRFVIEDWEACSPLQKAIAAAVWRGYSTPERVANYLQVSIDEVRRTLPSIFGLLLNRTTQKIWIK